jgi:hypothetical protein
MPIFIVLYINTRKLEMSKKIELSVGKSYY